MYKFFSFIPALSTEYYLLKNPAMGLLRLSNEVIIVILEELDPASLRRFCEVRSLPHYP